MSIELVEKGDVVVDFHAGKDVVVKVDKFNLKNVLYSHKVNGVKRHIVGVDEDSWIIDYDDIQDYLDVIGHDIREVVTDLDNVRYNVESYGDGVLTHTELSRLKAFIDGLYYSQEEESIFGKFEANTKRIEYALSYWTGIWGNQISADICWYHTTNNADIERDTAKNIDIIVEKILAS